MAALRVFISHATSDSAFAGRLATDLRNAGADVWLDSSHLTGPGDFVAVISRALNERDVLVLALSPAALASKWVPAEMNAAIVRANQGFMRPPQVVQCIDVPLKDIPGMWAPYQRINATKDYSTALIQLFIALGLKTIASSAEPDPKGRKTSLPIRPGSTRLPRKPTSHRIRLGLGLLFAIALILLAYFPAITILQSRYIGSVSAFEVAPFIIAVPFAFIGGYRAFIRVRTVRNALLTGMWISLLGIVLSFIINRIIDNIFIKQVGYSLTSVEINYLISMILPRVVLAIVIGIASGLFGGLAGLIFGAVGGAANRIRATPWRMRKSA